MEKHFVYTLTLLMTVSVFTLCTIAKADLDSKLKTPDAEIGELLKGGDYEKAIELAKERDVSPYFIGCMYALAGQKEEALKYFGEDIRFVLSDDELGKPEVFLEICSKAEMLESSDPQVCTREEFFSYLASNGIYIWGEDQARCENIFHLENKIPYSFQNRDEQDMALLKEAVSLADEMLDSSFDGEELILPVIRLVGKMQGDDEENGLEDGWRLIERLHDKYPNHPTVRLAWIDYASCIPSRAQTEELFAEIGFFRYSGGELRSTYMAG